MHRVAPPIWVALLLLHAGLALWAALGLVEFLTPPAIGFGLANPRFPDWMQLLHWLAIAAGAAAFLLGWRLAPALRLRALAAAYALMAAVCLAQTLLFLDHAGKWRDMALEYAAYLAILWLLTRLPAPPALRRPAG